MALTADANGASNTADSQFRPDISTSPPSSVGPSLSDCEAAGGEDQSDEELQPAGMRNSESNSPVAASTKGGQESLERLAVTATAMLRGLPPAAQQRAQKLALAMAQAVAERALGRAGLEECRSLQLGCELRRLEKAAAQQCAQWRAAGATVEAVEAILPHARAHGFQLVERTVAWLTAVAQHMGTNKVPVGLLPRQGCQLSVAAAAYSALHTWTASGVCAVLVSAELALRRMFVAYSETALAFSKVDDPAVAARARAVKRDSFLLAGTCTNLIMDAFQDLAVVLEAVAVR